jgi:ribonuclease I
MLMFLQKFSKKLSLRMRRDWPSLYDKTSEELWKHEWEQHGYFSDMNCEDYCRKGLFFHQNCDVKKALEESGIHPSNNPINTKFFMNQLTPKIGGEPELMCHNGDLIEVRCCFERNGMRTNCPQTIHCGKRLTYLPVIIRS